MKDSPLNFNEIAHRHFSKTRVYVLCIFLITLNQTALGQKETLNSNVIGASEFNNGAYIQDIGSNLKYDKWNVNQVKTGKKDQAGNEVFYYQMVNKDTKDSAYLVPDNQFYPLHLSYLKNPRLFQPKITDQGERVGFGMGAENYFLMNTKNASFYNDSHGWKYYKSLKAYQSDKIYFDEKVMKNEAFVLSEHANMWEACLNYQNGLLENLKGKKYDEMMLAFANKEVYLTKPVRAYDNMSDLVKITFTKDEKGRLKELVLNYKFMDGKYYDKPEMQYRIPKNSAGFFMVDESQKSNLIISLRGCVIPFAGGFLFALPPKNGTAEIVGCCSPDFIDRQLLNALNHNRLYSESSEMRAFSKVENYSIDWWKLKNVSFSYDATKDERILSVFLIRYWSELLKTI